MDAQRKKGVVDVLVLSVLQSGPSYGYKIIQDVSDIIEVSESTMYPIFRRLEKNGCVSTYSEEHNGRIRKYFSLTPKGEQRIAEFLSEWEEIRRIYEFIMKTGGSHYDETGLL